LKILHNVFIVYCTVGSPSLSYLRDKKQTTSAYRMTDTESIGGGGLNVPKQIQGHTQTSSGCHLFKSPKLKNLKTYKGRFLSTSIEFHKHRALKELFK
jgi:hypothetical protein